jgi:hypothetical protein
VSLNKLFRILRKHDLLTFYFRHRDKSGGYSFFGNLNLAYILGLFIILIEIILLIYTHRIVAPANILSLLALSGGFIAFTFLPVFEVHKSIKWIESKLKREDFGRFWPDHTKVDVYHMILHYKVRFSPYNVMTVKIILGMRFVSVLPAMYKIFQYTNSFFENEP